MLNESILGIIMIFAALPLIFLGVLVWFRVVAEIKDARGPSPKPTTQKENEVTK